MMAETKNLEKTASLAAGSIKTVFYRGKRILDPEVAFYLRDNSVGQIFYHTVNINEEVASWGVSDWIRFIRQGIENYLENSKFVPDEVASIAVSFKLGKGKQSSLYTVENTDPSRIDTFDHFMVTNAVSDETYEIWFTSEQRASIKSVFSAVGLVEKIGLDKLKLRKEKSSLPWICLYGNKQ